MDRCLSEPPLEEDVWIALYISPILGDIDKVCIPPSSSEVSLSYIYDTDNATGHIKILDLEKFSQISKKLPTYIYMWEPTYTVVVGIYW